MKITIIIEIQKDDKPELVSLTEKLQGATAQLASAVNANEQESPNQRHSKFEGGSLMANPVLQQLADQVTATTTVIGSAVVLINGITDRITAAVAAAIANGATEAELAPITDEVTALKSQTDALAAAVQANTPLQAKK